MRWQPKLRFVATALLGLSGCGKSAEQKSQSVEGEAGAPLSPWLLGEVARPAIVPPPPCRFRAPVLRAVVPRTLRLFAEPTSLGRLLVAEAGPSPQAGSWRPKRIGMLIFVQDQAKARPARWPQAVARQGSDWLVASSERGALRLWRNADAGVLGRGIAAVGLSCAEGRCALLSRSVDATTAVGAVWFGGFEHKGAQWQQTPLHASGSPLAISRPTGAVGRENATVALQKNGAVQFTQIGHGAAAPPRSLHPNGSLLEVSATSRTVLAAPANASPTNCTSASGGVSYWREGTRPLRLRSPLPATSGAIRSLTGGTVLLWQAPDRCGAPSRAIYASVLDRAGEPIAPVTAMASADHFFAASHGRDLDLWLQSASHQRRGATIVTYLRMRCELAPGQPAPP